MSRIAAKFRKLKKEGRKALIPFITAGDPTLAVTEKLIFTLEEAGADIIELGVPFSDPMADGPVIQAASERALKHKITLEDIFKLVTRVRKKSEVPLLLMGYYNPLFVMGHDVFAKKASAAGVDAVLIVDLPPEEARPLRQDLRKNKINLVHLLAPTSDESRIQKAAKSGSGFLYYVSLTGVTGATLTISTEIKDQIDRIRKNSSLPIAVGFGVSNSQHVQKLAPYADGVVVGSALVKIIASLGKSPSVYKNVGRFIQSLRKAIG